MLHKIISVYHCFASELLISAVARTDDEGGSFCKALHSIISVLCSAIVLLLHSC